MKKGKTNFRETVQNGIALLEQSADQPGRRIRGIGAVADTVNFNRRLYPADVLREAVRRAQAKLSRSLGNGHILGEADHPYGAPRLRELVVKWEAITFNDTTLQVEVEGRLIPTAAGADAIAMMESGVLPGLSLRGYGDSDYDDESNIETVTYLELTGFDLVFEPAFEAAGVTVFEQHQHREGVMEEEEKGKGKEPVVNGKVDAKLAADLADQTQRREAAEKAMAEAQQQAKELTEAAEKRQAELEAENARLAEQAAEADRMKREAAVAQAIEEAVKDLPYGVKLNESFIKGVRAAGLADVAAVAPYVAAKREEYDAIMAENKQTEAAARRSALGLVNVIGPVFEQETGQPAYTQFSHLLREQLAVRGLATERDAGKGKSRAEMVARQMTAAFDKQYGRELIAEHRAWTELQEATATSDLNLPYAVSRAIIGEAVPEIVAANVFDFGLIDASPTRVWFEAYAGESGSAPAVVAEVVAAADDAWVSMDNKHLRRGTVVVTNSAANVTYTEWTDYMIDYADGRLYTFSAGAITDAQSLKVSYTYDKVAPGEGAAIQRGKGQLSYQDVSVHAHRLAGLINDEAIAFGQSQLGWDAPTRVISMLIRELREMIDLGIFSLAIAASVQSGNSGGTWTSATDTEAELVKKLGIAKVAVENDYYMPRYFVMSKTNADRLSNWTGLTREGFPDALLGAAGFANMQVKGLPVFATTAMPDSHILVVHPELVQHRVLSTRPMSLKGPFQYRDTSANLVAAQEWYVEEYNGSWVFINNKGGSVRVA